MFSFDRILQAIRRENLGGWLFYNHNHRDPIADKILDIRKFDSNSRPWVYLVLADGTAVKIVHQIEERILDCLPGEKSVYSGRAAMSELLREYVGRLTGPVALNFSSDNPRLSFIDHGTVLWLSGLGAQPVSAESCVHQTLASLSSEELESHEAAAVSLYRIVEEIWEWISRIISSDGVGLYEGKVLSRVMELFDKYGLETEPPLIIGSGHNTTLPHYSPEGKGQRLLPGQVVQIDIWGKQKSPGAIYADISWVGYLGTVVPQREQAVFDAIVGARDAAVDFITQRIGAGKPVTGAEVDAVVDRCITERGYNRFVKHRTGHSIDTDVHGTGINIDSREFPDHRALTDGSCFSIEPGLYLEDFGMRTEIDVFIKNETVKISGKTPQRYILCLE